MKNTKEENIKKFSKMKIMNEVALKTATKSVNSTCSWVYHQPAVPEELKKFKKI